MVAPAVRKKNEFQIFHTNCDCITSYMLGLLQCDNSTKILEPCAGEGAFLDEILNKGLSPHIKAYDLSDICVAKLFEKYGDIRNIQIEKKDFLLLLSMFEDRFDRVIANPPYGAYQSPEKRKQLRKDFPNIYTKETYGLFLAQAMEMLNACGRLVFIIPDTYMTLHMHEGLRKLILNNYRIESITLFPSNFFPGVNFGYAGLSIISIVNEKPDVNHEFPVYGGFRYVSELPLLLADKKKEYEICRLSYKQAKKNPSFAFFIRSKKWIDFAINSEIRTVGDICSVVTGFYSGNDGKYLRRSESVTRGKKKYALINANEICDDDLSKNPPLNGLDKPPNWIPIVKGGNKRFHKPSEWFVNWSKAAVHDYRVLNRQKARFQNSQFYFRQGIAVPMVSSSSITASLLDARLFDQSVVGIFPHEKNMSLVYYLLGFFNSKVCNELIRTINASANNSANYLKKIPLIIPHDDVRHEVATQVERLISTAKGKDVNEDDLQGLNAFFDEIYDVRRTKENI